MRKKEVADKAIENAGYLVCLIDGQTEKVANYMVEPPGLFRGRGDHPHIGMVKSRVVPEYTSINIGHDQPIPPCPVPGHAWKRVISNNEATWLAHFKDEKNKYSSSNTGKYLFLAADSKLKGDNDKKKYERARRLKACIHKVRSDYDKLMASDNKENQQLGVASYFIDRLALRVGNEKNEDEADTVGCCSLRVEHVTVSPDSEKLIFDFLGKDSMRYYNEVEVPTVVYKIMKSL